jgi:glycosyltransferase involved in cell wall biosynthesis
MRVLGFGTYDVERHPRIGILLDGLRERGHDVSEANVPLGISTADRIAMVNRPWLAYRLVLRLLRCWVQLSVAAIGARRRYPRVDAVVVGYLGQFDVLLARVLFPRTLIVLDQLVFGADTAADRGLGSAGGLRRRMLHALDTVAARAADLVVVDTAEHLELLPPKRRSAGVVVAVGAPASWLRAGARRTELVPGPLEVVFFGLFTPLQGAEVIGAALAGLADRPDIRVTMIGDGQQHDRARELAAANASVRWVDWVAAAELPDLVAAADVCLGIFGTGAKARRVVPNKVYQGAAVGAAIVTSDTAPQRRCLGAAARYVPAGDPDALAAALRQLADDRAEVARLGAVARALALESFTAGAVVSPLLERMTIEPTNKERV